MEIEEGREIDLKVEELQELELLFKYLLLRERSVGDLLGDDT